MVEQIARIVISIENLIVPNWALFLVFATLLLLSMQFFSRIPKECNNWRRSLKQRAGRLLLASLPVGIVFGAVFASFQPEEERLAHIAIFLGNVIIWPVFLYGGYVVSVLGQKVYWDKTKKR